MTETESSKTTERDAIVGHRFGFNSGNVPVCGDCHTYEVNGVPEHARCQKPPGHIHYHEYVGTVKITWIGNV